MMTHEEDAFGFELFIGYLVPCTQNMVRQWCDLKLRKAALYGVDCLLLSLYPFCTLKKQVALYQSGITGKMDKAFIPSYFSLPLIFCVVLVPR